MRKGVVASVVIALLFLPACSDDGDGPSNGSGGNGGGSVLRIVVADEVAASWTLAELEQAVPFTEIDVDGDTQSGPLLLDVFAEAGISDWKTAEVLGKGEGRSFDVSVKLAVSDVDEEWVLDVSNRGTLKLAAANLPRQEWVRDVAEIRLR